MPAIKEIQNVPLYKFADFSEDLQKQYVDLLKFLRPFEQIGPFKAANLWQMEFGQVAELKVFASRGNDQDIIKMLAMVFGINEKRIPKLKILDVFGGLSYIRKELQGIVQQENQNLMQEPTPEEKQAGSDRLARFREMNILIALGKEFGKSPMEVNKWQYQVVYTLIWHRKIKAQVDNEHHKIIARRARSKAS